MKVAQFNTFPYGGAATAARRLHQRLLENDVDSHFYYHRNEKNPVDDPNFHQLTFPPQEHGILAGAVQRRIDRRRQKEIYQLYNDHIAMRPAGEETFSMARLPSRTPLDWASIESEIVHLHWISFFADYPSFFRAIPNHVPIVWTLHDMNAFTGGCHYSNDCTRFKFGCGGCHQVTQSGRRDVSADSFQVKQKSLRRKNITVVTPSNWMRELAMTSQVWPASTTFQTIRLGFDLDVFHPIPKLAARQRLGISNDAVLIGFGAEDINNRRKGLQHLIPALSQLKTDQPVECLVFGSGEIESAPGISKFHQFGYVDSPDQQALIYSAADMVVVPSREDNQPQVGLEAMACGTPVVGFKAGGIPEYVRHGTTGMIAALGDEAHLAEQISWLANNAEAREQMGQRARLMMEQEFDVRKQSEKYLQVYRGLLGLDQVARAA